MWASVLIRDVGEVMRAHARAHVRVVCDARVCGCARVRTCAVVCNVGVCACARVRVCGCAVVRACMCVLVWASARPSDGRWKARLQTLRLGTATHASRAHACLIVGDAVATLHFEGDACLQLQQNFSVHLATRNGTGLKAKQSTIEHRQQRRPGQANGERTVEPEDAAGDANDLDELLFSL
eukprot:6210260-Pleurochrysis_carterae.AAC.1